MGERGWKMSKKEKKIKIWSWGIIKEKNKKWEKLEKLEKNKGIRPLEH